jgi:hypothetical protein
VQLCLERPRDVLELRIAELELRGELDPIRSASSPGPTAAQRSNAEDTLTRRTLLGRSSWVLHV